MQDGSGFCKTDHSVSQTPAADKKPERSSLDAGMGGEKDNSYVGWHR